MRVGISLMQSACWLCKRDTTQFKRAVEMNLRESDGLMVFDIVHIINRDWWGPLQRAVSAYEAEAKQ